MVMQTNDVLNVPSEIKTARATAPPARGHRRNKSAPACLVGSVLGKRPPSCKSRTDKLKTHRANGTSETLTAENPVEEEGTVLSFSLKQGKEGSRDGGKLNKHPTWIRSNMRATWGHLTMQFSSPEEAAGMEALLANRVPYGEYTAASIVFKMLYENGDEVELLEKKGGNLADRLKLILPGGNVDQGMPMSGTSISYHTAQTGSKQSVKSNYFQFEPSRFPWNSDKKSKIQRDHEDSSVEIGLKFATNVTTRAHDKRRFMWKVEFCLYGEDGKKLAEHATSSPAFAYLPRNPEKSIQDFRLDDVICDNRPGDLVMCGGAGLGSKERPQLIARLCDRKGVEFTLERERKTKSTFVTRLPADLLTGTYTLQLVNEDSEEYSEEVKIKVLQQKQTTSFDLECFAQQLEEHTNAHTSSTNGSDDESSATFVQDSPQLGSRSLSHSLVDHGERMG